MNNPIDVVIPYVDSSDKVWQKAYIDFCKFNNLQFKVADMQTERYRDNLVLINYQLKLINKFMPWIRTIHLLLMNREQAPKDLPSNVNIVYHAQFIPKRYLPTFNSTTIEMFLWNIPNLSEKFIYANDDMLPLRPLTQEHFFDGDKVRIEWWEEDIRELNTVFRLQSYNSYRHTLLRLGKGSTKEQHFYLRPAHSFTPMIKSHCEQAYKLLHDLIEKHIRAFRTQYQYNQYIYPCFELLKYGTSENKIDFLYTQLKDNFDMRHDIVCFNIIPPKKAKELKERLEKLL